MINRFNNLLLIRMKLKNTDFQKTKMNTVNDKLKGGSMFTNHPYRLFVICCVCDKKLYFYVKLCVIRYH